MRINDSGSCDATLDGHVNALLRRACLIARALTGAEQAALKLWVDEDAAKRAPLDALRGFVDLVGLSVYTVPASGSIIRTASCRSWVRGSTSSILETSRARATMAAVPSWRTMACPLL